MKIQKRTTEEAIEMFLNYGEKGGLSLTGVNFSNMTYFVGEGKSKELLLWGELIDAQKWLDFGLVNRVDSTDALTEAVNKFASMLCATNSAQSMAYTKQMIADVQNMTLDEGLNHASTMNATARASEDCKKGIASFLNKEKLNW